MTGPKQHALWLRKTRDGLFSLAQEIDPKPGEAAYVPRVLVEAWFGRSAGKTKDGEARRVWLTGGRIMDF